MGVLLVIFLFKDHDFQCTYLPNNRVLVDLNDQRVKSIELDSSSIKYIQMFKDSIFLNSFFLYGKVDFKESKVITREEIKYSQYPIQINYQGTQWKAIWERREDTAVVLSLTKMTN
jgi:hypothetical protein